MAEIVIGALCGLDEQWLGYWGELPTGVACGEPSTATVTLACVDQHVDAVRICRDCAVDVQQAAGTLTCKRCWDGDPKHACYMRVVIDWDSGEKTIVQEKHRG
jgi:hypothetical protein